MKKGFIFTLLALVIATGSIFVNEAQALDYKIYGKVLYGSSASSETVAYANITVYRLESGSYVLHGNTWTDACGEYEYLPGEGGSYKLVFWETTRDVVDILNSCVVVLDDEPLTQQIVYPPTLTIFNKVAQANIVTVSR